MRGSRLIGGLAVAGTLPFVLETISWWSANALGLVAFSVMMPSVAGAACWIVWRTPPASEAQSPSGEPRRGGAVVVLALASLAASLVAHLVAEPILGALGLYLAVLATLGGRRGPARVRRYALPLTPLLLLAPLTRGLPARLELLLQHASARVAEGWLELGGIDVVREGVLLQTPTFWNVVDDTCSGLDTFTALLLYALVLGLLLLPRRRGRLVAVMLATLPLSLLLNGGRIAWISVLGERGGVELATGPMHDVAGWSVFAVGYVFVLLGLLVVRRRTASSTGTTTATVAEAGPTR